MKRPTAFIVLLVASFSALSFGALDYWTDLQAEEAAERAERLAKTERRLRLEEIDADHDRFTRALETIERVEESTRIDSAIRNLEREQINQRSQALWDAMVHKDEQNRNELDRRVERNMAEMRNGVERDYQRQQQASQQQQIDELRKDQARAGDIAGRIARERESTQIVVQTIKPETQAPGYNPAYPGMQRQQQYKHQQNKIQEIQGQQQYDQQREMMRNQGWGRPGLDGPNY